MPTLIVYSKVECDIYSPSNENPCVIMVYDVWYTDYGVMTNVSYHSTY